MKVECPDCGFHVTLKFSHASDGYMVWSWLCRCGVRGEVMEVYGEPEKPEKESDEPEKFFDYAVVKKDSGRARRVFDERAIAELYWSKLGNKFDYEIEPRERA